MTLLAESQSVQVSGNGLITNLPVTVSIESAPEGHGIVFWRDGEPIPARLESIVNTNRGVTLASANGKTLSIVEHFLCACAAADLTNLKITVDGAPELPLMDGSAQDWIDALKPLSEQKQVASDIDLPMAVFHRLDDLSCVYAIPANHLKITYAVDYPHPKLEKRFVRWDSKIDCLSQILSARTYGFVKELPLLQAQGLAMGVTPENTVGLTEEGEYLSDLRIEDEPLYHKMLELLGELMLTGVNPRRLKAHIFAINAGHGAHAAFAQKLSGVL